MTVNVRAILIKIKYINNIKMFEIDKKEKQKIKAIDFISRVKDINVLK